MSWLYVPGTEGSPSGSSWRSFAVEHLVRKGQAGALDEAPIRSDLSTFNGAPWRGVVDLVTAGFPCQPFSSAGARRGTDDERWLWPDIARVLRDIRPRVGRSRKSRTSEFRGYARRSPHDDELPAGAVPAPPHPRRGTVRRHARSGDPSRPGDGRAAPSRSVGDVKGDPMTDMKPVLVTTEHRGVFAGLVPASQDLNASTMRLEQARMAIYWGTTKGVAELAHTGPTAKSRIGAPATIEALHAITAVWAITEEAWEKWNR